MHTPMRVLILDDEKVIADAVCMVLNQSGYKARSACRSCFGDGDCAGMSRRCCRPVSTTAAKRMVRNRGHPARRECKKRSDLAPNT